MLYLSLNANSAIFSLVIWANFLSSLCLVALVSTAGYSYNEALSGGGGQRGTGDTAFAFMGLLIQEGKTVGH